MNILIYPRGLPQSLQRFFALTENFGVLFVFSMSAFLAIFLPYFNYALRNGMPNSFKNSCAMFIVRAVVQIVTFKPYNF